jgi:hypothetical protein
MTELNNLSTLLKEREDLEKKIADEHQRIMVNMSYMTFDVSTCLISSEEEKNLNKPDEDSPKKPNKINNPNNIIEETSIVSEDKWYIQPHQRKNNKNKKSPNRNRMVRRQNPTTLVEENIPLLRVGVDVGVSENNNLSIPAIKVQSFDDVENDGSMYYVQPANHFATYICNKLYHGNIGMIYNNEKFPLRVKNCQYHQHDYNPKGGKCNYYHDPLLFKESSDVRNYVSNSWKFMKNSHIKSTEVNTFGSITTIEDDIVGVSSEDTSRFMDMTFHNILYSLILSG